MKQKCPFGNSNTFVYHEYMPKIRNSLSWQSVSPDIPVANYYYPTQVRRGILSLRYQSFFFLCVSFANQGLS